MECLVPLNTSFPCDSYVPPAPIPSSFTLTQALAEGVNSVTFDLSSYNFNAPPTNIIGSILLANGGASNISLYPLQWTATSYTADFSSPTDSADYVVTILIIPAIP